MQIHFFKDFFQTAPINRVALPLCAMPRSGMLLRDRTLQMEANRMTPSEAITPIEQEWDVLSGSLGKLSEGNFDEEGYSRFLTILKTVDADHTAPLSRRFVSLTWCVPRMLGDLSLIHSNYKNEILKMQMQCEEELTRIFGTP